MGCDLVSEALYRSIEPLGPEETLAIVLTCSDRRIRRPVGQFIAEHLGLSSYDTVAVPGGPYILAEGVNPGRQDTGIEMIRALVTMHDPRHVILISHQDCGRYQLEFEEEMPNQWFDLTARQRSDLLAARASIAREFPGVQATAFFAATNDDDTVTFEVVD